MINCIFNILLFSVSSIFDDEIKTLDSVFIVGVFELELSKYLNCFIFININIILSFLFFGILHYH